jgi:hypothetical protein
MTREDVIRMAKEAKLNIGPAGMGQTVWGGDAELERFAVLVAAAEREACATECERMMMYPNARQEAAVHDNVWAAAKAIRARSQA